MAPEYLSPGVYVEEVPSGNKPIEAVSTSTVGFIGQSRKAGRLRGRMSLDAGISDKCRLGLGGLDKAHLGGADTADPQRREHRCDLFQLALVMGRNQEPVAVQPPHQIAAFCASTSSAMPDSERSSSLPISSRLNVAPSADICTSIRRPRPVRMKFPSVPASLSSA